MSYELKFVWLGRLFLGVLVLLLGCDLALLTNFPLHMYAIYLGLASCLVVPYFLSRFRQGLRQGKAPGVHLYRLLLFILLSFGLALVWSLKFAPLQDLFRGQDLTLLGPRDQALFISYFAIKAVLFALSLVCLTDALWRGHLRRLRQQKQRAAESAGQRDSQKEAA